MAEVALDTEHRIEVDERELFVGTECSGWADTVADLAVGTALVYKFLRNERDIFLGQHFVVVGFGGVLEHCKENLAFVGQMFVTNLLRHRLIDLEFVEFIGFDCIVKRFFMLDHPFEGGRISQKVTTIRYLLFALFGSCLRYRRVIVDIHFKPFVRKAREDEVRFIDTFCNHVEKM